MSLEDDLMGKLKTSIDKAKRIEKDIRKSGNVELVLAILAVAIGNTWSRIDHLDQQVQELEELILSRYAMDLKEHGGTKH